MKVLVIRHVPDDVHRALEARAALAGLSLSDYVLAELRRSVERPTTEELIARVRARPRIDPGGESAAEATRIERDAR